MSTLQLSDPTFERIASLMHSTIGLSFAPSKKPLMSSRLSGRLQRLGLPSFDAYAALIEQGEDGGEFQMAVDLLTTNETYFFREPKHFDLLEHEFPGLPGKEALAVWSAASSFGDEAYSTAMLLQDLQTAGRVGPGWSILATDISHRVLLSAKAGVFPVDHLRDVSPERLRRYCLRGDGESEGQAMVQDKIRAKVQFGQLNLCKPFEGLGPFDVIFLRNVLIYFDAATKTAVVDRVLACLKPGGLFFLGTAEGRVPCNTPLQPVIPGAFRKLA